MIRTLIVNEIQLMCNVITSVLEEEEDINVVGVATTLEDALQRIDTTDIILVSTHLPEDGALLLTSKVMEAELPAKVVVLGLAESESEILRYVEVGAAGYVLKDDSVDELLRNIRAIHRGEAVVSPEIAAALMSRVTELAQLFTDVDVGTGVDSQLTDREQEILGLISQGMTNREIADQLIIEVGTVKNHVHNILNKLNVSTRHEAAAFWAIRES
ncbi:MAG: LuxR C-terminal-related transcriptional regulator [Anaerolineales bacterium]